MENAIVLYTVMAVSLLTLASIVLALSERFNFPFSILLVLVGFLISQSTALGPQAFQETISQLVSPNLILYICLPTLIFESAFHLEVKQVRDNIWPILFLAVPGFLISVVIIGFIVTTFTPLDIGEGLLLGAILSATDPVAVVALFKKLGTPKRLTILMEGESLFNDATAIVVSKIIFSLVVVGLVSHEHVWAGLFHWDGLIEFVKEFSGGIAVGLILAYVFGWIIGTVESNALIEISLTTILAYAVFISAEYYLHVSGVIATVTAGLVLSGWGRTKISPAILHHIEQFWSFLAYVANSLVFILVGISIQVNALVSSVWIISVVIFGMLLSRAVIIYCITPLLGKLPHARPIDLKYQAVLFWGSLRGAIAIAIVLGLGEFEHRELLVAVVLGCVLFTLIVNGLTMDKLVRLLGLDKPPLPIRLAKAHGLLTAVKKSLTGIPELQKNGLFSARIADEATKKSQEDARKLRSELILLNEEMLDSKEEVKVLFYQVIAAEKSFCYQMFSKGHLSDSTYLLLAHFHETLIDNVRSLQDIRNLPLLPSIRKSLKDGFINLLTNISILENLTERMRGKGISLLYEVYWGMHQSACAAISYLDEMEKAKTFNEKTLVKVKNYFQRSVDTSREQMDAIAEQFPEFVTTMQQRLAERMMLSRQSDVIQELAVTGELPLGVAEDMENDLNRKLRALRERPGQKITLDPMELLRKVPFFSAIPHEKFAKVTALLHQRIVKPGDIILQQGAVGESMFLIMRGVVRISREVMGKHEALATLISGDFFGEMALLHLEPRTATCRAVTPCALYELRRDDFNQLISRYPSIKQAIEDVEHKRREELNI